MLAPPSVAIAATAADAALTAALGCRKRRGRRDAVRAGTFPGGGTEAEGLPMAALARRARAEIMLSITSSASASAAGHWNRGAVVFATDESPSVRSRSLRLRVRISPSSTCAVPAGTNRPPVASDTSRSVAESMRDHTSSPSCTRKRWLGPSPTGMRAPSRGSPMPTVMIRMPFSAASFAASTGSLPMSSPSERITIACPASSVGKLSVARRIASPSIDPPRRESFGSSPSTADLSAS